MAQNGTMTGKAREVRVRAACPRCGDVSVLLSGLRLVVAGDEVRYEFHCPSCRNTIDRMADEPAQRVLARNQVEVTSQGLAEELREAKLAAGFADDPDHPGPQ